MKTFIFSATKSNSERTLLYKTCNEKVFFVEHNKKPLSVVYNKAIDFAIEENVDNLILCHDDIVIESAEFLVKLENLHRTYDVIGVAGTSEITIQAPVLWHLMGGGFSGGKLHGAVAHTNGEQKHMSSFGVYPSPAILVDGVFMSISKKAFSTVRFDESNPASFHFYDLAYCLDCSLQKIRVGVGDILITHSSPGLREFTNEFNKGQEWFLKKYEQYQNKKLTI